MINKAPKFEVQQKQRVVAFVVFFEKKHTNFRKTA